MPDDIEAAALDTGYYAEVGRRVREARELAEMTQADLAARIGMTRSSIANFEAGRQRVPLHLFAAAAVALETDAARLLALDLVAKNEPLRGLASHLETAPGTTREFVESVMAQLSDDSDREA